jgi:hypothetical protein
MKSKRIFQIVTMLVFIYASTLNSPVLVRAEKLTTDQCEKTIEGIAWDSETGESVPGVSVLAKGTTIGTVTDAYGYYRITVPCGSTLVFWFTGFLTVEIPIENWSRIDPNMVYCDCPSEP